MPSTAHGALDVPMLEPLDEQRSEARLYREDRPTSKASTDVNLSALARMGVAYGLPGWLALDETRGDTVVLGWTLYRRSKASLFSTRCRPRRTSSEIKYEQLLRAKGAGHGIQDGIVGHSLLRVLAHKKQKKKKSTGSPTMERMKDPHVTCFWKVSTFDDRPSILGPHLGHAKILE